MSFLSLLSIFTNKQFLTEQQQYKQNSSYKLMHSSVEQLRRHILTQKQSNSASNYLIPIIRDCGFPPKYTETKSKSKTPKSLCQKDKLDDKENFYYQEDSFGATKNSSKPNRQSTYIQENDQSQQSKISGLIKSKTSKILEYFQANRKFTNIQLKNQISFDEQQVIEIEESFKNESIKFYDDGLQENQNNKESILYEHYHQTQQSQKNQGRNSDYQFQSVKYIPMQNIKKTAKALYYYSGKQEKVFKSRIANIDDINQRIRDILNRDIDDQLRKRRIDSIIRVQNRQFQSQKDVQTKLQVKIDDQNQSKELSMQICVDHDQNKQRLQIMARNSVSVSNTPKAKILQTKKQLNQFNKKLLLNRQSHMKDFTFSQPKEQPSYKYEHRRQQQTLQNSNGAPSNLAKYRNPATPIKKQPIQNKGKMLDYQIQKLNNRIRASQDQKHKLNIDFKPFSVQKRDKSKSITVRSFFQRQTQTKYKTSGVKQILQISKHIPNNGIYFRDSTQNCLKVSNEMNQQYAKDIQRIRAKYSQGFSYKDRVKKSIKPQQTQRLIKNLRQQVGLDQIFRNQKMKIQQYREVSEQQWGKMIQEIIRKSYSNGQHKKLSQAGQNLNLVKSIFKAQIEQNNPFFNQSYHTSVSGQSLDEKSEKNIRKLIDSFIKAQTHWDSQIKQKYDRQSLQAQRFTIKGTLDMENKGWIAIQDLVRFVNMGTGQFFRTRDFYLIYKRFIESAENPNKQGVKSQCEKKKKIDYEQFAKEIFSP